MTAMSETEQKSNIQQPRIAVLLPCYNEAASIAKVVAAFKDALPTADIYVYDNNSTDNTAEEALHAGIIVRSMLYQKSYGSSSGPFSASIVGSTFTAAPFCSLLIFLE